MKLQSLYDCTEIVVSLILFHLRLRHLSQRRTARIPHISDKMLTTQLRQLEDDGYIDRKVYAIVPPKTEYSLTKKGEEIIELITTIRNYGLKMIDQQAKKK